METTARLSAGLTRPAHFPPRTLVRIRATGEPGIVTAALSADGPFCISTLLGEQDGLRAHEIERISVRQLDALLEYRKRRSA